MLNSSVEPIKGDNDMPNIIAKISEHTEKIKSVISEKQKELQPIIPKVEISQPAKKMEELKSSIMVDYDSIHNKFTFYDVSKKLLGSFTAIQLVKYVTSKVCPLFLTNHDAGTSYSVIETFLCKVCETDGFFKIELVNHIQSCFTGNIDMIMKLYQGVHQFEMTQLTHELDLCLESSQIKKKIISIIKQLIYILLNHILKLAVTISESIRNDPEKKTLKETLLKYSIGTVYKLIIFMKDEISQKAKDFSLLQEDIVRLSKIKLNLYQKVDMLDKSIKSQNRTISAIVNKLEQSTISDSYQYGGTNTTSQHTTSSHVYDKTTQSESHDVIQSGSSNCHYTESGNDAPIKYLSSNVTSTSNSSSSSDSESNSQ